MVKWELIFFGRSTVHHIVNQSQQTYWSQTMLKGKTAIVTGSTSGIGLGIAKALARQGASIVLNGFGDVEGPRTEIAALGAPVGYHGADMSKPAEIADMVRYATDQFGTLDILVNNAGIQHVAKT